LPLIASQDTPGDYVLATGEAHSVTLLCQEAFAAAGLDWLDWYKHDPALKRPADVARLKGDATKAAELLGWQAKVKFAEVVRRLVEADLQAMAA
jgi:GDPmannose 4,6-dehydratase